MPRAAAPREALRRAADPRVFGGVLIMVCSAYAGLAVLGGADGTVLVAVASRDLPEGMELTADDYAMQAVMVDDPGRYLQQPGLDDSLARPVGKGELIPVAALTAQSDGKRRVAVPIEAVRLPPEVARGSQVDVWRAGTGEPVLRRVSVVDLKTPDDWAGATATLVLSVPEGNVADLLSATQSGAVDVTTYPRVS